MLYAFTTLLLATLVSGSCNADNCLRAMRATQTPGRLQAAQSFCATFTQSSVAATAIPTYATEACTYDQNGNQTFRISSACSCIAASKTSVSSTSSVTGGACATVSSLAAAQLASFPFATATVAASLAHDCLNSVPLNKDAAIALVDSMEPYLEWQSDSAYKKDPPPDYFYPPHDIFGYLASVKANLENDVYANEYAFQEDLYNVFAKAHDGHFVFYPDALTEAIEWGRQRSLISISKDGSSIPQIYLYEDATSSPSTASVVCQINGIDAATYVADFAYTASFNQDADAAYNTMFFEKAFVAGATSKGYFSGGGRMRFVYPGANTTFTFENGTILTLENVGKVKGDFTGVTDGASFYTKFCTGSSSEAGAADALSATDAADVVNPGYPQPIEITGDGIVSGYYLDGAGFEDVAVISLLAFESESPLEFQQTAQKFFADAIQAGKTKLVIDLSANGGGYILQGYDLFRQLFPHTVQDGFSRLRESDSLLAISKIYSDSIPSDYDPNTASVETISLYENFFNYRYDLNELDKPFQSFNEKFAAHVFKSDDFTDILRWNLDDPLTTSNETFGLGTDITGYGSRKNFTQPFKPENIIMLMDGYCASTCTLFAEMMRIQGGVKTIAMGGRPQTGPIQGVGGIKGAQILAWGDIYSNVQEAISLGIATPEETAALQRFSDLPVNRSSSSGINIRDQILRGNLEDGLPAQFVVEEADCRLYYTLPMITDVTELWKSAASSAFNGASCAAGSLPKREAGRGTKRSVVSQPAAKPRHIVKKEINKDPRWGLRHGRKVIAELVRGVVLVGSVVLVLLGMLMLFGQEFPAPPDGVMVIVYVPTLQVHIPSPSSKLGFVQYRDVVGFEVALVVDVELFGVDAVMLLAIGTLMLFGQEFPAPPDGVMVVVDVVGAGAVLVDVELAEDDRVVDAEDLVLVISVELVLDTEDDRVSEPDTADLVLVLLLSFEPVLDTVDDPVTEPDNTDPVLVLTFELALDTVDDPLTEPDTTDLVLVLRFEPVLDTVDDPEAEVVPLDPLAKLQPAAIAVASASLSSAKKYGTAVFPGGIDNVLAETVVVAVFPVPLQPETVDVEQLVFVIVVTVELLMPPGRKDVEREIVCVQTGNAVLPEHEEDEDEDEVADALDDEPFVEDGSFLSSS
ncbi:Peptidase S41 family protein [Lachnellula occidentalis]|uniref:Peptidase S41 family protein n=1 Tax=Lachnellula occidentalis TaxID=215460 RepID=A0A8H8UG37_9HELO|nr:Peptidase S41 family protein [Lachnellula occidentalis]